MSTGLMTVIQGNSLELGELPFNIHARDQQGNMVLYGRKGINITSETREKIIKSRRSFYIEHSDLSTFIDYKLKRVNEIIDDKNVEISVKQSIIKDASSKIMQRIQKQGFDSNAARQSQSVTEGVVSLIMNQPESHSGLLSISSLPSYFYDHALNASTMAIMLGHIIYGTSKKKLYLLGLGSLLMDVGMSKMNSGILNKRGELETREIQYIRKHTEIGHELLNGHDLPEYVADMALHHHERLDGSGYPDRLRDDSIRPYLRICAAADVYDALTSNRAFRKPMKEIDAIAFMLQHKSQFSIDVLNALMKVVLKDDRLINMTMAKYA